MSIKHKDFLEFDGINVSFTLQEGTWWIALKPICDALNVDWLRQWKKLQVDPILSAVLATKQIFIPFDQFRDMVCLPEQFVYGWLFQIQSSSPGLVEYKWKCYHLLYNHFHGTLIKRHKALIDKNDLLTKIIDAEEKLLKIPDYIDYLDLKLQERKQNGVLKQLDKDILDNQMDLGDW